MQLRQHPDYTTRWGGCTFVLEAQPADGAAAAAAAADPSPRGTTLEAH